MADYSDLDPAALRASLSDGTRLKKSITTDLYTGGTPSAANQVKPSIMYADGTLKESITYADGTLKPSWLIAGGGGGVAGGKLLQMTRTAIGKSSTTAVIPADDTIPQSTEGLEIYSASFTPLSATSTIVMSIDSGVSRSVNGWVTFALFVDSETDAFASGDVYFGNSFAVETFALRHSVASGSTSARTYKIRFGPTSGTAYNYTATEDDAGGVDYLTNITIMEVEG